MSDAGKTLSCPKCQFGNPPDAVTCAYCQETLPFAQETRRISRKYARKAMAAARAAQAMQAIEDLPTPSSDLIEPVVSSGEGEVVAWLSCPPLSPIPLGERPFVSLGRGADCDVVLPHTEVSRHHAVLKVRRGAITVEDEGSSNGTHINGKRITAAQARVGDTIGVGPYVMDLLTEQEAIAASEHLKGATGMVLKGDLREVSAPELLQNIEFNKWTGVLQVVDRKGRRAELCFVGGALIRAEFAGHEGEEAVLGLVLLDAGRFSFNRRPMTGGGQTFNLTRILLDASRVQDEGELPEWIREGVDLESGAYGALLDSGDSHSSMGRIAPPPTPDIPEAEEVSFPSDRLPVADEEAVSAVDQTTVAPLPEAIAEQAAARPPERSSLGGMAFALLLPLLVVVPLATRSYTVAFMDTLSKQRADRIDKELVLRLEATYPLPEDARAVAILRERLEGLQKDAPDLDLGATPRHLSVLEGLLAVAKGDPAAAKRIAARPVVKEHPTATAALRGALTASTTVGPSAQAFEDLTYALERGIARREMREWRIKVADSGDEAQLRVALADLGVLSALPGGLSEEQRLMRVQGLLLSGYLSAAESELAQLRDPPLALTYELAMPRVWKAYQEAGPEAALTLLAGLPEGIPGGPFQDKLLGATQGEINALLARDPEERTDEDLIRCLALLRLELRLGRPLAAETLDAICEQLADPARSADAFVAAERLFVGLPVVERRRLLIALFVVLEAPRKQRTSRFKYHVVMCSLLRIDPGPASDVGAILSALDDDRAKGELYYARALARERYGRLAKALRDVIRAKRLKPELDVVADLSRLRRGVREQGQ